MVMTMHKGMDFGRLPMPESGPARAGPRIALRPITQQALDELSIVGDMADFRALCLRNAEWRVLHGQSIDGD